MLIKKIYLSGSQQPNNIYADKLFTEEEVMHALIWKMQPILEDAGFEVRCSDPKNTMNDNIREANAWIKKLSNGKYDGIYIANHTNAFDTTHDGLLILYCSAAGKLLAECMYPYLSKVLPNTDEGLRKVGNLAELNNTKMTAILLEHFFHDNVADMKAGVLMLDRIAEKCAEGIIAYCKKVG